MTKISIDRDQLRAALCAAAVNDVRYYINGVYVEANSRETRVVATTGSILIAQRSDATGDNDIPTGSAFLTIPFDVVKSVKADKMRPTVELNGEGMDWVLSHGDGTTTTFKSVEGKFPDYRRVIPQQCNETPADYNFELAEQFVKAVKILHGKDGASRIYVKQNGKDAAFVGIHGNANFAGVLMPKHHMVNKVEIIPPPIDTWMQSAI